MFGEKLPSRLTGAKRVGGTVGEQKQLVEQWVVIYYALHKITVYSC